MRLLTLTLCALPFIAACGDKDEEDTAADTAEVVDSGDAGEEDPEEGEEDPEEDPEEGEDSGESEEGEDTGEAGDDTGE